MENWQKYLFDLNGYLVLDNVLTADHCGRLVEELYRLSEVPNDQLPGGVAHDETGPGELRLADITSVGPVFADLIDLPPVIDVLKEVIHRELRLEISYAFIRKNGFSGLDLHGGGHWDGNGQDLQFTYRHFNGNIFCGNTVVAFNLTDVSEEEGGFICVPGSHKANFPIPDRWKDVSSGDYDPGLIRSVPCNAGSVVIFPEALCHGASPRRSGRDRVSLFYKYNHVGMKWRTFFPDRDALERMTPNQRSFYTEVASDFREGRVVYRGRELDRE